MEQVRSRRLDNVCEGIAEERALMNKARLDEKGLIQSALQAMQKADVTIYRHGGVELARVPGAEKLRVRLTKEEGDADVSGGVTGDLNENEDLAAGDVDAGAEVH